MILSTNFNKTEQKEGGLPMKHEHKLPAPHIPPHQRKAMVQLRFEDEDWALMKEIFGDEDTAAAAADILLDAPPEIQILAVQLFQIIKEVA